MAITLTNPTAQAVTGYLSMDSRRQALTVAAHEAASLTVTPEGQAGRRPIVFTGAPGQPPLVAFVTLTEDGA